MEKNKEREREREKKVVIELKTGNTKYKPILEIEQFCRTHKKSFLSLISLLQDQNFKFLSYILKPDPKTENVTL